MTTKTDQWIEQNRRAVANSDQDRLYLLCGRERTGKSNMAMWLGCELDPTFDETRMCFSAQELMQKAEKLPPGSAIVLDEAIKGGFGRDAMAGDNKDLAKFLVVCGTLNLHIIVCFPNIRFLDSYVREHRANWFILMTGRGQGILHRRRPADYPGAKTSWPRMWGIKGVPFMGDERPPLWDGYVGRKRKMVAETAAGADQDKYVPTDHEVEKLAAKCLMVMQR